MSVGVRSLILSISMPEEFRNLTKGLLGNYNRVKDDDFVLPDGTVLSDSLSDKELHQQFGNACKSVACFWVWAPLQNKPTCAVDWAISLQ